MNTNDMNSVYRPVRWQDVKGQEKAIEILKAQVKSKSGLSNFYVFAGPSGVGKTTLTRLFFMALNCSNLTKDLNPCGTCPGCTNFSFDFIEVNASDTNGVDDMRELIKRSQYTPTGSFKGILLDEGHMLSAAASDCLLKPLETAQKRTIWFLCTTNLAKVKKTLLTRSQTLKLSPLKYTEIYNRLQEIVDETKVAISEEECWTLARNSDFNLRQAIHLLEQFSVIGDVNKVIVQDVNLDFLKAVASNDLKKIWEVFDSWDSKYNDMDTFLNALKWDISAVVKIKLGLPVSASPAKLEQYYAVAPKITEENALKVLEIILSIQEKVAGVWDYNSLFLQGLCKLKK